MAVVFLAFFAFSTLSDPLLAEKDSSNTHSYSQPTKVAPSLPEAKPATSTTSVSATDPSQQKTIEPTYHSSTHAYKQIVITASSTVTNLSPTVRTSHVLGPTSPLSIGRTSVLTASHNLTTRYVKLDVTRTVISAHYSSNDPSPAMTPSVNTTGATSTTKRNTKRRNLVILYSTIFSVVGFVLVVIIGVVVVGCRRSEIKGAFKFSMQLDHELGNFENLPRAKSNSPGNNTAAKGSTVHNGVPNGVITEHNEVGSSADHVEENIAGEDENKSIANKAYESNPLDPDEDSS